MSRLRDWINDYVYLAKGNVAFQRKPPRHYRHDNISGKVPVILLSGLSLKWQFLRHLGNCISRAGHPVFVVPNLGRNHLTIAESASQVRALIEKYDLRGIVIIAHSKGGIIAKYLMVFHNQDKRVKTLIAIATPFYGSRMAKAVPHHAYRELTQESDVIQKLQKYKAVNKRIVSVIPEFDNHVWAIQGSYLEGAHNINVAVRGHHKVVFDKQVEQTVLEILAKEST